MLIYSELSTEFREQWKNLVPDFFIENFTLYKMSPMHFIRISNRFDRTYD